MKHTFGINSLALGFAVLISATTPSPATAYVRTVLPCGIPHWDSDPVMIISTRNGQFNTPARHDAVVYTAAAVSDVDAQTFDMTLIDLPVVRGEANGLNEIWMQDLAGSLGLTNQYADGFTCEWTESDVLVDNDREPGWDVPVNFYAHEFHPPYGTSFAAFGGGARHSLAHEFLHLAGLAHESDEYAIILPSQGPTYYYDEIGVPTYTNHSSNNFRMRPAPDDMEGLRAMYGSGTPASDIAVANAFMRTDGSIRPDWLCNPTKGSAFTSHLANQFCGSNPPAAPNENVICPGDILQTAVNILNYKNSAQTVTLEYWFSTNDVWSTSDTQSSTTWTGSVTSSRIVTGTVAVPSSLSLNTTYWVYARVPTLSGGEYFTTNNYIPLSGTVRTKASCP
jgi:hypothetical protein